MDGSKKYDNPNPRSKATFISLILFWWLKPLFCRKNSKDLELKDLYNNLTRDLSEPLTDELERHWNNELKQAKKDHRKPKLLRAIKKVYFWSYLYYGGWIFILFVVLRVLLPYTLGLLIWHFDPRAINSTQSEAYIYASAIILLSILIAIISRQADLGQMEIGMRLRIACCSLMYRKILRLSCTSSNETTQGQIINLMSNDVARFDRVFIFLHYIWIMPFQAAVITYMIWRNVGVASLTGVVFIAIQAIPIQGFLGKHISNLRLKIAVRCDERVRIMGEIIRGVRVIKMYTWEKPFENLVARARSYEVQVLTLMSYIKGFNLASYAFTERTTLFLTIMVYVLQSYDITADKAFSMAQYFNILQLTMAIFYPLAVSIGAESLVSIERIQNFLLLDEQVLSVKSPVNDKQMNIDVKIQNVTASWNKDSIVNTLYNINLLVPKGKLYAIVGPVGEGKSSLLKVILDELPISHGQLFINGNISYASQEPWLFPGTIRNNILFGQPFEKDRYERVTRACALNNDFEALPQGDKTYIGDRGGGLSGGQCARVNLARALYRDANIYLLDDPFSAVDTHVGKYLFDECIAGYLKTKTRIIITHQIQYLKNADSIVLIRNGKIEKQGTYADFKIEDFGFQKESSPTSDTKTEITSSEENNLDSKMLDIPLSSKYDDNEEPAETEELIAKGKLSKMLFWKYFHAGASAVIIMTAFIFAILVQILASGTDYWLAFWTKNKEMEVKMNLTTEFYIKKDTALLVYGGLVFSHIFTSVLKNIMIYEICMNASKNLHNLMFSSLLKAPMQFFDNNPAGRILNRFSKDIGAIDELLPDLLLETAQITFVTIGILTQVLIINWWTIFPIIILGYLFLRMRNFYMSTAQSIWRLEGVAKSPVFSHVNASLSGLTTIRSFQAQQVVCKEFDAHQDLHTKAHDLSISASNAFGLWIEMVSIAFVAFVTYSFIIVDDGNTFAGNVGLALSQVLILCGMLQHGMRQLTEAISKMTSVERVIQFTELKNEGEFESDSDKKPPPTWPNKGRIVFNKVFLKYAESEEPVLKNVTFVIEPKMKVGVVGRTGAGKSSLITALFHLAHVDGSIEIDGINTSTIGLHDLRRKMSIIPQDPMLFYASLRYNLDPFHEYEDLILWSALEDVELKSVITALDQRVTQDGSNFSTGQKQLLCLARAVIRKNKILILDEATANVDPQTDELIQKTVRNKFQDCTVLTIAHRLQTIMDSDKVLVMDNGQVVEFDHPHILLQNVNGYFTKLVLETDLTMSQRLKIIAEKAYNDMQAKKNSVLQWNKNTLEAMNKKEKINEKENDDSMKNREIKYDKERDINDEEKNMEDDSQKNQDNGNFENKNDEREVNDLKSENCDDKKSNVRNEYRKEKDVEEEGCETINRNVQNKINQDSELKIRISNEEEDESRV